MKGFVILIDINVIISILSMRVWLIFIASFILASASTAAFSPAGRRSTRASSRASRGRAQSGPATL